MVLTSLKQYDTYCHLFPIYYQYSKQATVLFELNTTTWNSVLLTCFNDKDNDMTNQKQINENRKIESQHAMNAKTTGLIN